MKKKTMTLICLILGCLMAVGAFTGCSGDAAAIEGKPGTEASANEQTTPLKDTITIAIESEPPTLHPFDHKAVTAGYMNNLTYNCLFKLDTDTLQPIPDLCESYEQLSETLWTFKIKEGVKYHNGMEMTADDVKASMEYAKTFTTTADYTSFWTNIEVKDNYTIEIDTGKPYALTLNNLSSIKIIPKALIDEGHDFGTDPIGSGPYAFKSYTLGDKIEFEAFDQYFDTEHMPKIKNMIWRIIPEGTSRTIALEAGEIDVIIEPDANDITRMESDDSITVMKKGGTRVNFLTVNTEKEPFNNIYIRKAINAAIDKEAVVEVALNGEGKAAISQTPMVFEGASETGCDGYDLELAKSYMKQSGLEGTSISFTCYVFNDTARRAAEVIQASLLDIGMELSIESLDYATYLNQVFAGNYEMAVSGYTSGTMYNFLYGIFHSDSINAANMARINDSHIDELIELGKTQSDIAQRGETFKALTDYINSQTIYIPLYQSTVIRAYNSGLGGFEVSAAGAMHFEDVYWQE
ncbi:MAG: ABC transporter substrate-binding protein [Clostridiaceae bacterium]|nr:ABC transporter substrate-binding protein [Clostridiaceae bacterium]